MNVCIKLIWFADSFQQVSIPVDGEATQKIEENEKKFELGEKEKDDKKTLMNWKEKKEEEALSVNFAVKRIEKRARVKDLRREKKSNWKYSQYGISFSDLIL